MDHAEAREILEIAAAEPSGLERLIAGDTAEAAALAGHLVACEACSAELGRLRRIERLLRGTVSEIPPPELRERTLSFVRALGRDRSMGAVHAIASAGGPTAAAAAPVETARPIAAPVSISARLGWAPSGGRRRAGLWLASMAAAVAIAVVGTASYVGGSRDAQMQRQRAVAADLASLGSTSLQLMAAPDARVVDLTSSNGAARGLLVFAPSRGQVAVTAAGLTEPTGRWTYRCWASVNGQKRVLGWMHFENGLAYWLGPAQGLDALGPGTEFGVSLVDESTSGGGEVVLQGTA